MEKVLQVLGEKITTLENTVDWKDREIKKRDIEINTLKETIAAYAVTDTIKTCVEDVVSSAE
jgi:hypothetical protein